MAGKKVCPKCKQLLAMDSAGAIIVCAGCGAKFRRSARSTTVQPDRRSSAPPGRKPQVSNKEKTGWSFSFGSLGGISGTALLLIYLVVKGLAVGARNSRSTDRIDTPAKMVDSTANLPTDTSLGSEATLADLPPLPPAQNVEDGISLYSVSLQADGQMARLKIYLPKGVHSAGSLPTVFIVPAGTNCITGIGLGDSDSPEHLPYVRAGFAVVAFSLPGELSSNPTDQQMMDAVLTYWRAHGGMDNARNAIKYALTRCPAIDPNRLFAVGHSSAASFALVFAANDPRIQCVVAYNACIDMEARLAQAVPALKQIPNYVSFFRNLSPKNNESKLNCPVMLFHADDDSNVPISESVDMADRLNRADKDVTFVRVPTGNHYDSMIKEGIPAGIRWLKSRTDSLAIRKGRPQIGRLKFALNGSLYSLEITAPTLIRAHRDRHSLIWLEGRGFIIRAPVDVNGDDVFDQRDYWRNDDWSGSVARLKSAKAKITGLADAVFDLPGLGKAQIVSGRVQIDSLSGDPEPVSAHEWSGKLHLTIRSRTGVTNVKATFESHVIVL